MSTRNIAVSTLWQIASQVVMAALSIVTVKFVAIGLSKELAGNYNSAYGFLQLFGILADFGLYAVAVREVSSAKNKHEVLGAIIVLRLCILLLSLGTALTIAWAIPAWQNTPLPLGITIASLVPFFTLMAGIVRTVFQVQYKMHSVFIAEVVQRIITTTMIGAFIVTGTRGSTDLQTYHMFLFTGGIGAFVLFFISMYLGNKLIVIKPNFDGELIAAMAKKAAPYGLAFLCTALYRNIDVTLIALLRDDFELQNAYYGFVLRMAEMGYLIPTFLLNSTLPVLSKRHAAGEPTDTLLGKTLFIILLLGSVTFLFSFLWARPLVLLLTTEAYLSTDLRPGSDTALMLLSVPMLLNGVIAYGFYVLLTAHEWKRLVISLCIGSLLSVTLNLLLIPTYGFRGAGYTSIAVHTLLACVLLPQALRHMPCRVTKVHLARWAGFTGLLAIVLAAMRPLLKTEIHTVVGLFAAGVAMAAAAWLCGIHRSLVTKQNAA